MGKMTNTDVHGYALFGSQMLHYACLTGYCLDNPKFVPGFYSSNIPGVFGFLLSIPFVHKPTIFHEERNYIQATSPTQLLSPEQNYDMKFSPHDIGYALFDKHRDHILNMYEFLPEIRSNCKKWLDENVESEETLISLHFRRGDYLLYSSLNLSLQYFYEAVQYIKDELSHDKIKFVCFSNDIPWVRENFVGIDNMVFVDSLSDYEQMCLMSMCHHNIVANSTYSFWGAYLNNNPKRIIICPKNYVDPKGKDLSIFPAEWVRMNSL